MGRCHTDSAGCTICDAVAASPAVPPSVSYSNNLGWNARADSEQTLDGDLHLVFSIETLPVGGVVCGLRAPSPIPASPPMLTHAFMVSMSYSYPFFDIYERGAKVHAPLLQDINNELSNVGDTLEVRRQGGIVTYWYTSSYENGPQHLLVYTSNVRSIGPVVVSGCLYASGDTIG